MRLVRYGRDNVHLNAIGFVFCKRVFGLNRCGYIGNGQVVYTVRVIRIIVS
jgi:hypothetical protein